MPKQEQRAEVNSFVKGLITEASALNFPADAISVGENFDLHRDGTISRRLGMDYEDNYQILDSGIGIGDVPTAGVNTFRWLSVSGNVDQDFLVVQVSNLLHIFTLNSEPLSSGFITRLTLTSFPTNRRYSFAALEGKLAVVGGVDTIAVVEYKPATNTFTTTYNRLMTRDVWGVEESQIPGYETDPSFRTNTYSAVHFYNLHNQSWGIPRVNATGTLADPAAQYFSDLGTYPSNIEQVWAGLQFQAVSTGQAPFERQFSNLYKEGLGAKPESAKGYFIIDVLRRGQSRLDQLNANLAKYPNLNNVPVTLPADLTSGGAKCIADYAGRVFYGGFDGTVTNGDKRSPSYTNYIFFSQVVKQSSDFFKCYQDGDPTSRDNADLLDTDGGFLRISEAKDIIALRSFETSLIVIASNGVWSITGGSDYGFSATNYKVTKISSFGGLSESSLIVEGGRGYFWSEDGIYTVGRNQFGDLAVDNISISTVQKFYEAIPSITKKDAVGNYDIIDKKVRWIYKSNDPFTEGSITYELVLDTALSAFSLNRINNAPGNKLEVFGLFRGPTYIINSAGESVVANTDTVLVGTDTAVIDSQDLQSGIHSTRYLALLVYPDTSIKMTFSQYNNTEWIDWQTFDGIGTDAAGFILSGAQTAGDSAVKKQAPYLVMHMRRTETTTDTQGTPLNKSSCLIQYQWDFSSSANSKKWSPQFQVYRYVRAFIPNNTGDAYDNGFSILTTKNKVRGMGRAFAMRIDTEPKKDCQIIGWNLTITGNQVT